MDFVLVSPEGVEIVVGNGSERARLLASGYRDKRADPPSPPVAKPEPKQAVSKPETKPEVNKDSK